MNIHQLGVTFDPMQDRLLLRINTTDGQELEVWLTRRIALLWLPALSKLMAEQLVAQADWQTALLSPHDKHMYAQLKLQEQWGQSDFSTPFQRGDRKVLDHGPLLLTDLQMEHPDNGWTLIRMQEREHEHGQARTLEIKLQAQLMSGLLHMLQEVMPTTGWTQGSSTEELQPQDPELHAQPSGRLLN
jgi:hypothetical protein